MKYYNYEMLEKMQGTNYDKALQKYFDDSFGCACYFLNGKLDICEICKLSDVTINHATWTHYATIVYTGNGNWELMRQFMGENEDEAYIYGYYTRFGDVVRNLAVIGFNNREPIDKI